MLKSFWGLFYLALILLFLPVSLQAKPRFIIYYNSDASPIIDARQADYSHVIVSFLGAKIDQTGKIALVPPKNLDAQWPSITALKSKGIKVLISFGGGLAKAEDYKKLVGREVELARLIKGFVAKRGLDGVDLDFEASEMLHKDLKPGVAGGKEFLISLTRALRKQLPRPRNLISHAPQSPYLNPEWHDGPYLQVLKAVGDDIDWITIQYYNNPGQDGPASEKVVGKGSNPYSTSVLGLISKAGPLTWPAEKLVVGKPVYKADAFSGHLSPNDILSEIIKPLKSALGESFGGLAGWQYSTHTEDHRAWNDEIGPILFGGQ